MTTDAKGQKKRSRTRDRGRVPYRFTAKQVLKMVETGIIKEDVELWDGILYKMTKGELHNFLVGQAGDLLKPLISPGFHLREEKSSAFGADSLPEPDLAVARGKRSDYLPDVCPLLQMVLLVEVSHSTHHADEGEKLRRYAEVGVPVYWIVFASRREVRVHGQPQGSGMDALYLKAATYKKGDDFPVVIDGQEVGRIAVADIFPPEKES
jgi:Uma2 family endonuclease